MIVTHRDYQIDDDRARMDMVRVEQWLTPTYWWGELARDSAIPRAFANSAIVVGVYHNGEQVACCRVVTDIVRFAWLSDVFVDPAHRRKGIGRAMVKFLIDHPELKTLTRLMLATADAHDVYKSVGFGVPPDISHLMQLCREGDVPTR